jgi:predicted DNA-binding helix-hairpin-helix protein
MGTLNSYQYNYVNGGFGGSGVSHGDVQSSWMML